MLMNFFESFLVPTHVRASAEVLIRREIPKKHRYKQTILAELLLLEHCLPKAKQQNPKSNSEQTDH